MSERLPTFDGLLTWDTLAPWLDAAGAPGCGAITGVWRLAGGSQHAVFLLKRGDERMVLRRPRRDPTPSASETILKEGRILRALAATDVPHAELYAVCDDESVTGACFYVMEAVDGFTPMGELPEPYATDDGWRRAMADELIAAGARLSAVDPVASGLADIGRPDGWLERQVGRWRARLEQYRSSPTYDGELPHVHRVADWLVANQPGACQVGLLHGDFQFANALYAHDRPQLLALIDWELASLGDPRLDLGWALTAFCEDGDPPREPMVRPWVGMPSRADAVAMYGELSGLDMSVMPWFFVLACYRLGIVLEGNYALLCDGRYPKDHGEMAHTAARWMLEKAAQEIACS